MYKSRIIPLATLLATCLTPSLLALNFDVQLHNTKTRDKSEIVEFRDYDKKNKGTTLGQLKLSIAHKQDIYLFTQGDFYDYSHNPRKKLKNDTTISQALRQSKSSQTIKAFMLEYRNRTKKEKFQYQVTIDHQGKKVIDGTVDNFKYFVGISDIKQKIIKELKNKVSEGQITLLYQKKEIVQNHNPLDIHVLFARKFPTNPFHLVAKINTKNSKSGDNPDPSNQKTFSLSGVHLLVGILVIGGVIGIAHLLAKKNTKDVKKIESTLREKTQGLRKASKNILTSLFKKK